MIMIIDIFLCYVIFEWQLKIICRKSSAIPEQIHSPLFTHSSLKIQVPAFLPTAEKGAKGGHRVYAIENIPGNNVTPS